MTASYFTVAFIPTGLNDRHRSDLVHSQFHLFYFKSVMYLVSLAVIVLFCLLICFRFIHFQLFIKYVFSENKCISSICGPNGLIQSMAVVSEKTCLQLCNFLLRKAIASLRLKNLMADYSLAL